MSRDHQVSGVEGLDHLVLTVVDIGRTVHFYETALGMTPRRFGDGGRIALHFGRPGHGQKLNLHEMGREFEPKAKDPTPGSGDLCFIVDDLAAATARLTRAGVTIIEGPVPRTGAECDITSIYCRDPDGNLIELAERVQANWQSWFDWGAIEHLLSTQEMSEADRLTIADGTSGRALMEQAGQAVAGVALAEAETEWTFAVLCGPGNNGGDGYVAAQVLAEAGRQVAVFALGDTDKLTGDAAQAFAGWSGPTEPLTRDTVVAGDLVIDALFGAGLSRPFEPWLSDWIARLNQSDVVSEIISVDVPSGIDGSTGQWVGDPTGHGVVEAARTVTFFRRKPGHLLEPGRTQAGDVVVQHIGISPDVLDDIKPATAVNAPALWRDVAEQAPVASAHKYDHGHAVVLSGDALATGASRLAAQAAARLAGLVTLAGPEEALRVHANHVTATMLRKSETADDLAEVLKDRRLNSVVLGPALGVGARARDAVMAALASGASVTLDADALTSFEDQPGSLFEAIKAHETRPVVLTPHAGEFRRLFPEEVTSAEGKLAQARAAAKMSGAVVVFKGSDTVIAAPNGWAAINVNAPHWLATAGSGDVLAGLVGGLLARRWSGFAAACAAVWTHATVAREHCGPGMTADDFDGAFAQSLKYGQARIGVALGLETE